MQTTLDNFYTEYGIRNGQAPNETVLNRGLLRLKREIREIYTILQLIQGKEIEEWNQDKIYELDEYVQYKNAIFKSLVDTNYAMFPDGSEGSWQAVSFDTIRKTNLAFEHNEIIAEEGQTKFITTFRIDALPMVFLNGILLSPSSYTWDSKSVTLKSQVAVGRTVTIISGLAYESEKINAKREFIASKDDQYEFTVPFKLTNPSVFVDGILIGETEYSYSTDKIILDVPLTKGQVIVICNGALSGIEIFTQKEIEDLLDQYALKDSVYSKSETDKNLSELKNQILEDATLAKKDEVVSKIQLQDSLNDFYTSTIIEKKLQTKADKTDSLSGYGIKDAYTKSETETKLNTKLNKSDFNRSSVMNLIQNNTEDGTGLNADSVQGLIASQFMRSDTKTTNNGGLVIYNSQTETSTRTEISPSGFDPNIYISRTVDNHGFEKTSKVVNEGTSNGMFFVSEFDFYGTFWKNIFQFGIVNPDDYNWIVNVSLLGTGREFDFIPKGYGRGDEYRPFCKSSSDIKNGAYIYGFLDGRILKTYAYFKTSETDFVKTYGHVQLVGIKKNFCTVVEKPGNDEVLEPFEKSDFIKPYGMTDSEFNELAEKAIQEGVTTPTPPDIQADNAVTLLGADLDYEDSKLTYQSVEKIGTQPSVWLSQENLDSESVIYGVIYNGPANKQVTLTSHGDVEIVSKDLQFSSLGDLRFAIQGIGPFREKGIIKVVCDYFNEMQIEIDY